MSEEHDPHAQPCTDPECRAHRVQVAIIEAAADYLAMRDPVCDVDETCQEPCGRLHRALMAVGIDYRERLDR